jgi:bifunctional enzyme CysN/CysC
MSHAALATKSLLRFITCGSVDDGKSTLIGRLLYDAKLIFSDHLAALEHDSKILGTQGGGLDFALLVDGLAAEREQGITIDVAYRFLATEHRRFIVADTPGHEQYTRNMVTGASNADLAVILLDARKGMLTQTRRHSFLVSLLGIDHVVLAVNKLDLVGYSADTFAAIETQYRAFAAEIGLRHVACIPVSALRGDNITRRSPNMPWYDGPSLIEYLETADVTDEAHARPLRLPVQWVNRPNSDFRGFAGQLVAGQVRPGDRVRIVPSGKESTVARIVTSDGDLDRAVAGQSVTITLADELDVSRGDVIAAASDAPAVADRFDTHLVWMGEESLQPGRPYLLKIGTRTVGARIAAPDHTIDVNTGEHAQAQTLALNEIGACAIELDAPIAFDAYRDNRDTGGFILIDRISNTTVAAGMLSAARRRAANIHWQDAAVTKQTRAGHKGQQSAVVWFTGLSGAGKSTVANLVEQRLHEKGFHTYLLDGDNIRHGLNADLGFTDADRAENIRRVAHVAALMADAGLIVLASFISPFHTERQFARELVGTREFVEVHLDLPLAVAEARDRKGLYAKARRGELPNFTGIDSPYERPESPELRLDASGTIDAGELADAVIEHLSGTGVLGARMPSTP